MRSLRQYLEGLLARGLFALAAALPLDLASAIPGKLARLIGPRLKVSRVARRNLALAFPTMAADEVEAIVAEAWENLGRVVGEFPHLEQIARQRIEVVGTEHIHLLRDDGKCGLFFSGHFANWELGPATAKREGMPLHLVYREANNPWVERLYRQAREGASGGLIAKGSVGARQALEVLKDGGHLGMLVDQKMNDGIEVPFLGRPAMTAPALAQFALKYCCPVVPAHVVRLGGAHFRVIVEPPLDLPASGDRHADILETMTRVNAVLERWLTEHPGQWLWLHRRWPD